MCVDLSTLLIELNIDCSDERCRDSTLLIRLQHMEVDTSKGTGYGWNFIEGIFIDMDYSIMIQGN